MQLFQEQGVDTVFVVHFTSDFAKLSPAAFIDTFIRGLNIQHVTAGFDFSFGAFGKGTMEEMRALSNGDYGVTIVEKKKDDIEKKLALHEFVNFYRRVTWKLQECC